MGDAAAIADDIQAGVLGFQVLVDRNLHVIELDLHAVQQRIVVGRAGGDTIQGVDHFHNAIQDALGQHQAQIARRGGQGGAHQALLQALVVAAAAAHQIAEALHDDPAAQHIAEPRDAFAIAVAILEGLGKMLADQQGKVGILRALGRILIAVAVDGDDAVGILVYHDAIGIHAEGAHVILKLFGAVHDLAFIQLVRQVAEHHGGQLHAHADIHAVGQRADIQLAAHGFHPLAAAAAHGHHALAASPAFAVAADAIAAVNPLDAAHGGFKVEIHAMAQLLIQVLQHHIVDIRAQVAHGGVQQVQLVLDAQLFEPRAGGGIELGALAAMLHVDFVHVAHQLQRALAADMLIERAAEIVGDVIFAIRKRARAAKAAHDGAAFAANAGFHLIAVDGAAALFQRVPGLHHRDLHFTVQPAQFIGGKDTARARAHDDYVILHTCFLQSRSYPK